jgi:cupin superfamily acireductone dioxygenase involved in methionine salvage
MEKVLREVKQETNVLLNERKLNGTFKIEAKEKDYAETDYVEVTESGPVDDIFTESSPLTLRNVDTEIIYRLMGETVFKIDNFNGIGIRIETGRGNQFGIPHYIILSEQDERYEIVKHNLPDHVPISYLQEKYLNTNLQMFVKYVRSAIWKTDHTRS